MRYIDQIRNNFEFNSDNDSEISFFISTESVEDYGEAALFQKFIKQKLDIGFYRYTYHWIANNA